MPRIEPIETNAATGKAKELLDELAGRGGEPGPMVRAMANAPVVLRSDPGLHRGVERSSSERRGTGRPARAAPDGPGEGQRPGRAAQLPGPQPGGQAQPHRPPRDGARQPGRPRVARPRPPPAPAPRPRAPPRGASCRAARPRAARELGLSELDIERARQGTATDPKVAALVAYGQQ